MEYFWGPLNWKLPEKSLTLYNEQNVPTFTCVRNPVLDEILDELRRKFTQHMNSDGQQHIAISTTPSKSTLDSLSW